MSSMRIMRSNEFNILSKSNAKTVSNSTKYYKFGTLHETESKAEQKLLVYQMIICYLLVVSNQISYRCNSVKELRDFHLFM